MTAVHYAPPPPDAADWPPFDWRPVIWFAIGLAVVALLFGN